MFYLYPLVSTFLKLIVLAEQRNSKETAEEKKLFWLTIVKILRGDRKFSGKKKISRNACFMGWKHRERSRQFGL